MKRIVTIIVTILLAVGLAACSAGAGTEVSTATDAASTPSGTAGAEETPETAQDTTQKTLNIGIIQLMEHAALDAAREGFVQALADNGYVEGENLTLDVQNAQGDQSNLSTISDRFVAANMDLVLAIATPAAQAIAGKTTTIPILATAVTDYVVAKLAASNEVPGGNVSGTTDMNPIKEQIELILKLAPEAKTIGCIYNGGEDNSVLQAQLAKEIIEGMGLAYTEVTVTSTNDVQQAMQTLVGKCDAIYIPTDNTLASSMPIVAGVTEESKTPVVCGESGMVKAGGLATLGINYYNLGYQTGEMAIRILVDKEDIAAMPIEGQNQFDYCINGDVADAIGLTIPDDLKEYVVYGAE